MAATAEQSARSGTRHGGIEWHLADHPEPHRAGPPRPAVEQSPYVVDDGRRWLLAHPQENFDVIMMFPLHAAHAFSGALHSVEFFHILTAHLEDAGIVLLRTVDMFSTAKTIATVFPHVIRLEGNAYISGLNPVRLDPHACLFPHKRP